MVCAHDAFFACRSLSSDFNACDRAYSVESILRHTTHWTFKRYWDICGVFTTYSVVDVKNHTLEDQAHGAAQNSQLVLSIVLTLS